MKCILCNRRKGKRFCPAKNSQICTQCCGEKRVVEIDCPVDCPHLSSGQGYQITKVWMQRLNREEDPLRRSRLYENSRKYAGFLYRLEEKIIEYGQGLRSMTDSHVAEALRTLLETYKTEDRGILFEHSSTNPLVQSLVRELREEIEKAREHPPQDQDTPSLRLRDVLACLEVMENDVHYHLEAGERESYLTFTARSHPDLAARHTGSGLIQL